VFCYIEAWWLLAIYMIAACAATIMSIPQEVRVEMAGKIQRKMGGKNNITHN
jgi:hypothetical protein